MMQRQGGCTRKNRLRDRLALERQRERKAEKLNSGDGAAPEDPGLELKICGDQKQLFT